MRAARGMRERAFGVPCALVLLCSISACSAEREANERTLNRSLVDRFNFPSSPRPWSHVRREPEDLSACSGTVDVSRLCVGGAGEVWVDAPPFAELIPQLLPEALVDVWNDGHAWQILGRSGTVYVLPKPTEPVARIYSPPRRMDKVLRVGPTLIGISEGRLLRTDDLGASWHAQSTAARYPIDIAGDAQGRVALLDIPERLWQSSDGANHFVPLDHHANGTTALVREGTELRAISLLGTRAPILPLVSASVAATPKPSLRHPFADYLTPSDFADGRAADLGAKFLVARRPRDTWELRQGHLGRPLGPPLAARGLSSCKLAQFATTRNQIWAICWGDKASEVAQPVTVYVSENQGHEFALVAPELYGVPRYIRTASSPQAPGLLVSGICPPHGPISSTNACDTNAAGCLPRGIYRFDVRRRAGSDTPRFLSIAPLPTSALSEPANALAMDPSGRIVAAVARRIKTGARALLVSRDGARSFDAVPLFGNANPGEPDAGSDSELAHVRSARSKRSARFEEQFEVASLCVSGNGTISVTTKHGDHPRWSTFDVRGNLLSVAEAPEGTSQLSVVDDQALALSVTKGALYESVDRGANFEPIADLGPNACVGSEPCRLVCTRTGCLVGDRLTRIGFSHRILPRLGPPSQLALQREAAQNVVTEQVATCEIAHSGWQLLSGDSSLPTAKSASFGNLMFYHLAIAHGEANLILTEVDRTERTLTSKLVFAPIASGAKIALAVQRSAQGWATARIRRVGTPADPVGAVDLAWSNLLHAQHAQAQARFDEHVGSLSIEKTGAKYVRFAPALLSPQKDGLFVVLGSPESSGRLAARWITSARVPISMEFGGWQGLRSPSTELLSVLGQVTPIALAAEGMALLRGSLTEPHVAAITIGPTPTHIDDAGITYWGSNPGVLIPLPSTENDDGRLQFYQIVASESILEPGPIVLLPFGKGSSLGACDKSRRTLAKRLVIESNSKRTMHLLLRSPTLLPQRLILKRAVLYADGNDACWDALEATDESAATAALLFAQAETQSFAFRKFKDLLGHHQLEYATMSCHVEEQFHRAR